jgi:hypothetical protein
VRRLFVAALVVLCGCADEDGASVEHACKKDSDCPRPGMRCVAGAGVCVGWSTSLDAPDGGAILDGR